MKDEQEKMGHRASLFDHLSLLLFTTCPSVRQKSLLRVTISTKRNLLPPGERGRQEKGYHLFLIILYFTPLLSLPSAPLVSNRYQLAMPRLSHGGNMYIYITCN